MNRTEAKGIPDNLIELFKEYDRAKDAAWSYDGQLGEHFNPSGGMIKKARALWDKADEARSAFTKALGIEPTERRTRRDLRQAGELM